MSLGLRCLSRLLYIHEHETLHHFWLSCSWSNRSDHIVPGAPGCADVADQADAEYRQDHGGQYRPYQDVGSQSETGHALISFSSGLDSLLSLCWKATTRS